MNNKKLEQASLIAWNDRLYRDLIEPRLRKARKQARKARKQSRYRKELLASLNASASVNKPFVPRVIRKPAGDMHAKTSTPESANKLDSLSSKQASLTTE